MTTPMALANIERVDIVTEGSGVKIFNIDTASEASVEANVSSGNEGELRVKNQILAQNITEDIVKGYNLTLNDALFSPDVFALVDGGTSYSTTNSDEFVEYIAPVAGQVSSRTKFWTYVYAAEKDYDGQTAGYHAFIFPHCVGSPASVTFRDGEFFAPSYTLKSRPSKGKSPLKVVALSKLPVIVTSAETLPSSPVANETTILIAVTPTTLLTTGQELGDLFDNPDAAAKGEIAVYNGTKWKVR